MHAVHGYRADPKVHDCVFLSVSQIEHAVTTINEENQEALWNRLVVTAWGYVNSLHCKKRGVSEHPRGAIFYCFYGMGAVIGFVCQCHKMTKLIVSIIMHS